MNKSEPQTPCANLTPRSERDFEYPWEQDARLEEEAKRPTCPVPAWKFTPFPIVAADAVWYTENHGYWALNILCPVCGEPHSHGGGLGKEPSCEGSRISHCFDTPHQMYDLRITRIWHSSTEWEKSQKAHKAKLRACTALMAERSAYKKHLSAKKKAAEKAALPPPRSLRPPPHGLFDILDDDAEGGDVKLKAVYRRSAD